MQLKWVYLKESEPIKGIIMSKIPITMIFTFSVLIAQNTVKDFAPLKIGNVWEYMYIDSSANKRMPGPTMVISGSLEYSTIRIEVKSSHISGKDSVYILQSERKGITRNFAMTDTTTENISIICFDSAVVTDSAIIKGSGYLCPIFPVFSSHSVDMTSNLTRNNVVIGQDTLVRIILVPGPTTYYVQNTGLTYYHYFVMTNSHTYLTTAIMTVFNGKTIESAIQGGFAQHIKPTNPSKYSYHLTFGINQAKYPIINQGFLLNGVSVSTDKIHTALPMITVKKSINPKF
jgi:hypothetical protein